MGKAWDHGVPGVEYWREALRVAKPGAYLAAFGGTRTSHRLACAIEDAGWEIRDTLSWMYGQGFPKSLDVSKAIDKAAGAEREVLGTADPRSTYDGSSRGSEGHSNEYGTITSKGAVAVTVPATDAAKRWSGWGTALKPAFEPIILARKSLIGTVAVNVLAHGTGGINIDACRIALPEGQDSPTTARYASTQQHGNNGWNHVNRGGRFDEAAEASAAAGRWPANVVLGCACETEHEPDCAVRLLDEQTGQLTSGKVTKSYSATLESSVALGDKRRNLDPSKVFSDTGGASRFFYCAKASRSERTHGGLVENAHPTVKPISLMRWLVRLLTPPGGNVLDPFCGSGTTVLAADLEGFDACGIEQEAASHATACARWAARESLR